MSRIPSQYASLLGGMGPLQSGPLRQPGDSLSAWFNNAPLTPEFQNSVGLYNDYNRAEIEKRQREGEQQRMRDVIQRAGGLPNLDPVPQTDFAPNAQGGALSSIGQLMANQLRPAMNLFRPGQAPEAMPAPTEVPAAPAPAAQDNSFQRFQQAQEGGSPRIWNGPNELGANPGMDTLLDDLRRLRAEASNAFPTLGVELGNPRREMMQRQMNEPALRAQAGLVGSIMGQRLQNQGYAATEEARQKGEMDRFNQQMKAQAAEAEAKRQHELGLEQSKLGATAFLGGKDPIEAIRVFNQSRGGGQQAQPAVPGVAGVANVPNTPPPPASANMYLDDIKLKEIAGQGVPGLISDLTRKPELQDPKNLQRLASLIGSPAIPVQLQQELITRMNRLNLPELNGYKMQSQGVYGGGLIPGLLPGMSSPGSLRYNLQGPGGLNETYEPMTPFGYADLFPTFKPETVKAQQAEAEAIIRALNALRARQGSTQPPSLPQQVATGP